MSKLLNYTCIFITHEDLNYKKQQILKGFKMYLKFYKHFKFLNYL